LDLEVTVFLFALLPGTWWLFKCIKWRLWFVILSIHLGVDKEDFVLSVKCLISQ